MLALIDGDALIYKVGFATEGRKYVCPDGKEFKYKKEADSYCKSLNLESPEVEYEPEPIENALHSVKLMMENILDVADTKEHIVYLKNDSVPGFRQELDAEYKANRKDKKPPHHADNIRKYLEEYYTTELSGPGLEVDDMLGINQDWVYEETVIVSHDKDLLMIPGNHIHIEYNSDLTPLHITEYQAYKNFYMQCLTGDAVDNIPGIKGIGKKTAEKILDGAFGVVTMDSRVAEQYKDAGIPESRLEINKKLLWIKRDVLDLDSLTADLLPITEEDNDDGS